MHIYIILLIEIISKYNVPTNDRQLLKKKREKGDAIFYIRKLGYIFHQCGKFHLNSSGA